MSRTSGRLATAASRGAVATVAGQGVRVLVQTLSVIVLARLLDPADYGLVAMVLAIVGLGEIVRDFGLSSAAVQAKTLSDQERSNLFWINTGIGAVLTVLVFASSPLVALLYGEPRLTALTMVLSGTFLLNGLGTQFRADLNRSLRFGALSVSEVSGQVVGLGAGVVMALTGSGYWALAGQQIAQAVVILGFVVVAARFRPSRYRRSVSMRRFIGFGVDVVVGQLLGYAGKNVDTLMIGTTIGATALGYYNRAFQLLTLPLSQINAPSTRVALAVLAQLQHDAVRFARYLLAGQTVMLHLVLAIFSLTSALASPLILVVLGPQWGPTVPLFQILAVAGVFQTAGYATYWVFLAKGLTRSQLWWQLVSRPPFVAIIVVGAIWGVQGVAAGYAVASLLAWAAGIVWIGRVADVPAGAMFRNAVVSVVGYGLAGLAAAATLLAPTAANPLAAIGIGVAAWLAALALITAVWPAFRADVRTVIRVARTVRTRRVTAPAVAEAEDAEAVSAPSA